MGGGGAERQILEIIKRLDRARFEPLLYLAVKQGELLDEVPTDVPIFAFWDGTPETLLRRILRYAKLTRLLRHIHLAQVLRSQRIDVIYDRTYLATLDAAGGCWLRPTRRVSCCVADPGPELELHVRFSVTVSRWFARRAYRRASIVLANSEGLRNRVIEYFQLPPDHVKVFYNLLADVRTEENGREQIEPSSIEGSVKSLVPARTERELVRSACSKVDGRFLIVNAGRLHPQKGHRNLLEAIDDLVNKRGRLLRLVIFGKGETEAELKEFVRSHRLESSVTFAGFVGDPRHWYQNADLFVLPSHFEGMPNALIEAIDSGVPALSTDCPSGPREILDGGRCGGLVPAGDSTAIADCIAAAMDHRDEWRSRAELARERVRAMFDPDKGIRRLENLFEGIVAGN